MRRPKLFRYSRTLLHDLDRNRSVTKSSIKMVQCRSMEPKDRCLPLQNSLASRPWKSCRRQSRTCWLQRARDLECKPGVKWLGLLGLSSIGVRSTFQTPPCSLRGYSVKYLRLVSLPSKGGSVESLEGFKEGLRGLGSQSIRIMVEHLESSSDYQTSNAGARNSGLADTVRVRFRWFRSGRHA